MATQPTTTDTLDTLADRGNYIAGIISGVIIPDDRFARRQMTSALAMPLTDNLSFTAATIRNAALFAARHYTGMARSISTRAALALRFPEQIFEDHGEMLNRTAKDIDIVETLGDSAASNARIGFNPDIVMISEAKTATRKGFYDIHQSENNARLHQLLNEWTNVAAGQQPSRGIGPAISDVQPPGTNLFTPKSALYNYADATDRVVRRIAHTSDCLLDNALTLHFLSAATVYNARHQPAEFNDTLIAEARMGRTHAHQMTQEAGLLVSLGQTILADQSEYNDLPPARQRRDLTR